MQASLPCKQQQRPSKLAMQARAAFISLLSLIPSPSPFPPHPQTLHTHSSSTPSHPSLPHPPSLPSLRSSSTPSEISCTITSRRNTYPQHTRPPRRRHAPARATAQSTRYASQQQNSNSLSLSLHHPLLSLSLSLSLSDSPRLLHTGPPCRARQGTRHARTGVPRPRIRRARRLGDLGREGDAGSVQQAEVNADGTAEAAAAAGGGGMVEEA